MLQKCRGEKGAEERMRYFQVKDVCSETCVLGVMFFIGTNF